MYELPLVLAQAARVVHEHKFDYNIDTRHNVLQVVIPCTRYGQPCQPIIETVSTVQEAYRALGY